MLDNGEAGVVAASPAEVEVGPGIDDVVLTSAGKFSDNFKVAIQTHAIPLLPVVRHLRPNFDSKLELNSKKSNSSNAKKFLTVFILFFLHFKPYFRYSSLSFVRLS